MIKFCCRNTEHPNCPGRMKVVATKTLRSVVLRWRKCNECGYRIKTRETDGKTFLSRKRKEVSFSEMQKAARRNV